MDSNNPRNSQAEVNEKSEKTSNTPIWLVLFSTLFLTFLFTVLAGYRVMGNSTNELRGLAVLLAFPLYGMQFFLISSFAGIGVAVLCGSQRLLIGWSLLIVGMAANLWFLFSLAIN